MQTEPLLGDGGRAPFCIGILFAFLNEWPPTTTKTVPWSLQEIQKIVQSVCFDSAADAGEPKPCLCVGGILFYSRCGWTE